MTDHDDKRTVVLEDALCLRYLQGGRLSPDGCTVAYVVLEPGEKEDGSAIWLQDTHGGAARRLTVGGAPDSSPAWSPDGRHIAFISTRSGTAQLYVIPVDGGEARALTSLPQGTGGEPAWSPDGRQIAFMAMPREPPASDQPYRVDRHIYRYDGMEYLHNSAQDVWVVPAEGGEAHRLTTHDCQKGDPAWSPTGEEILFMASMFPDSHRDAGALQIVNLNGEVRDLVKDWGEVVCAAWTPDGRRVVFVGSPAERQHGRKDDVWVLDRAVGIPECRTSGCQMHIGRCLLFDLPAPPLFSPRLVLDDDGRTAFIQAQEGGTVQILRVALEGPEDWAPVATGERSCMVQDARAGRLLSVVSTLGNPADLYVAGLDGTEERRLTCLNQDLLGGITLPAVEHLEFPGGDGVLVEGWFLRPPAGNAPFPTVLDIHGGPHFGFGHAFSFDFQMLAGAGYGVLIVNQRGSTGYGDEFATKIFADWGNLDYRDLMAGIDYAVERGLADPERLGVCGLSAGGYLTCWIVGHTDRFRAAVAENPMTNWLSFYGVSDIGPCFARQELGGEPWEIPDVYRRCSPITYAHHCKTPTLLIQGENDRRCPAEQAEQFYTMLKAVGGIVEMLRLPRSSHLGAIWGAPAMRRAQNEALLGWMDQYVKR